MWRPEVNARCFLQSLPTLVLRHHLSLNLELKVLSARLALWTLAPSAVVTDVCSASVIYRNWQSRLSPQALAASTLPAKLSPQPEKTSFSLA